MSKLYLSHITSFSYSNFVVESSNQIILYPYNDPNQQVISHSLKITGNPNIYTNFDWYGNKVGFFNYLLPHKNLSIESEAEILVKKVELPKNLLNDLTKEEDNKYIIETTKYNNKTGDQSKLLSGNSKNEICMSIRKYIFNCSFTWSNTKPPTVNYGIICSINLICIT